MLMYYHFYRSLDNVYFVAYLQTVLINKIKYSGYNYI